MRLKFATGLVAESGNVAPAKEVSSTRRSLMAKPRSSHPSPCRSCTVLLRIATFGKNAMSFLRREADTARWDTV
jgi:hypothetical protein